MKVGCAADTDAMVRHTDYLDTIRPAGSPQAGVNVTEVIARSSWLVPVLLASIWFIVLIRHIRRLSRRNPG
jgi:hypothetical protein